MELASTPAARVVACTGSCRDVPNLDSRISNTRRTGRLRRGRADRFAHPQTGRGKAPEQRLERLHPQPERTQRRTGLP
jgi:hypothetical protein